MTRVTVWHLTELRNLPLIEEAGLRTRADLSGVLGPVDHFDVAAPGRFAHGKRVSAWFDEGHGRAQVAAHGPGLVSFSVDATKALAAPAHTRQGDATAYWAAARPLSDWLADGEAPQDLEVHQHLPVRAKHVQLAAPLVDADALQQFAPLVDVVADQDRMSAKALMHLAVIASDGAFDTPAFAAACALAWRDQPDSPRLLRELVDADVDRVASAALAAYEADAAEAVAALRQVLDEVREWAAEAGFEPGEAVLERSADVLDALDPVRPTG